MLPRLVYTVDCLETDMQGHAVWVGINNETDDDDIIGNTMNQSNNDDKEEDLEKEIDRKVIRVLKIPSRGSVSKFLIGKTDDTLEVEVKKHGFIQNPKALIREGVLDNNIDSPAIACGNISFFIQRLFRSTRKWNCRG